MKEVTEKIEADDLGANSPKEKTEEVNIVTITDVVVLPGALVKLEVSKEHNMAAIVAAQSLGKKILTVWYDREMGKELNPNDLLDVGCVCEIKQFLQTDRSIVVTIKGLYRATITASRKNSGYMQALVSDSAFKYEITPEVNKLKEQLIKELENYIKADKRLNPSVVAMVSRFEDPTVMADTIGFNLIAALGTKQLLLQALTTEERLKAVLGFLLSESEKLIIGKEISDKVRGNVDKSNREFYLREQMKAISEELGEGEGGESSEFAKKIESSGMPADVLAKAKKELSRLAKMNPMSPELGIVRTYLETLLDLPWQYKEQKQDVNLQAAREILDSDHYGMEDVKERIVEQIAVMQLSKEPNPQIICFVGPPGVGKTSVASSIARALGKKFVRVSLGGVKDEAEIRGHRRTYIGAMPGKIINGMRKAGTVDPVFLLDEIDKMASDAKGDPASAMLEVLDPMQNKTFTDHYLEVPYDLSRVIFICTANNAAGIPWALADRMEKIYLSSYTLVEKVHIVQKFLLKKCEKLGGLKEGFLKISDKDVAGIIESYTMEPGVRDLERVVQKLCRKIAVKIVGGEIDSKVKSLKIAAEQIEEMLGKEKIIKKTDVLSDEIGVVNALAYTDFGGDIIRMEVAISNGKGELKATGNLGKVMSESTVCALSVVRSNAEYLKIDPEKFDKTNVHIHAPDGAQQKEGPSAGAAETLAMASAFSGRKVRGSFAMTGEITLSGKVLPIGGVKEKVLAAYRHGIKNVILPKPNERNLVKVPAEVKEKINFHFVENIRDVFSLMLI